MRIIVLFLFLTAGLFAEMPIEQLERKILYYREVYQNEGKREVTDRQYDSLLSKLKELNPKSKVLQKNYPAHNGEPAKLLSLNKVYKEDEVFNWCEKVSRDENERFIIQPKYDGVAVLHKNSKILTRNGEIGEVKRFAIRQITNGKAGWYDNLRGELLISDDEFSKLCGVSNKYSSPRHATVAFTNSKEMTFWKEHKILVDFVCFDRLEKLLTLTEIRKNWKSLKKEMRNCGYDTDGLVIKIADGSYYKSLGSTEKFPKGAVAFKWECERKWTVLKDVEWQLAEKGIVPVGLIEKVSLDGANVSRVSLHSLNYINEKGLGVGDMLAVERVGSTVPVIKDFKKMNNSKAIVLDECPECFGEVDGSQCVSQSCSGKVTIAICKELKSRKVKGVGRKTVQKLVTNLKLKSWNDFSNLSKQEIMKVKGFGEKTAEKIISQL